MTIPRDYIKCIEITVITTDLAYRFSGQLKYMFKEYMLPRCIDENFMIKFTLIRPLDECFTDELLMFDGIDEFYKINYIPYTRDENIDELIDNGYDSDEIDIQYLSYLMQFMPDEPILEKLSSIKFTVDIPNKIIEADKAVQQINLEEYFGKKAIEPFTNMFFDDVIYRFGYYVPCKTRRDGNILTFYYINLHSDMYDEDILQSLSTYRPKYLINIEINDVDIKESE
jgi:hypothetical protein